jgi:peptidoglycan/LPS O-acetylase OafA/YrhL
MTFTGQDVRPHDARKTIPQSAPTPAPSLTSASAPARPRLLILDVVRLVAALMVVAWHLIGPGRPGWEQPPEELFGWLTAASRYGWLGVSLFFLISGFVIAMSSWGRTVGEFAVSRAVRLYPAYWVAVGLTTVVLTLWPGTRSHQQSVIGTLANLTMLQNLLDISHVDRSYWTLAIELHFYVLFVIVVACGVTYRRTVAFCAIWLLASLLLPALGSALISTSAPYFIGGIALYLIYRFGQSMLLWGIVTLSWLLSLVYVRGTLKKFLDAQEPIWLAAMMVTGFYLLMIAIALGWFSWFRWSWAVRAGSLTYPLYLLHQEIGLTMIRLSRGYLPAWLLLPLVVIGLMVLAWLVHRLVEVPGARWLKRGLTDSLHRIRIVDREAAGGEGSTRQKVPPEPEPETQDREAADGQPADLVAHHDRSRIAESRDARTPPVRRPLHDQGGHRGEQEPRDDQPTRDAHRCARAQKTDSHPK